MSVDSLIMPKGIYKRVWLKGHVYEKRETECPVCHTKIQAKRKDTFCFSCQDTRLKAHWKKVEKNRDPLKRKDKILRRLFGISLEEYKKISEQQKDCCVICKKHVTDCGRSLDVDHCHTTKKVRGLLCNQCNQALGLFKDNIKSLKRAVEYLEKYNA